MHQLQSSVSVNSPQIISLLQMSYFCYNKTNFSLALDVESFSPCLECSEFGYMVEWLVEKMAIFTENPLLPYNLVKKCF